MLKNTAYAWRQMIVFLSELDASQQSEAWGEIEAVFSGQSEGFRSRLGPAMIGLRNALEHRPRDADGGQIFLGWTLDRHPFAPPTTPADR